MVRYVRTDKIMTPESVTIVTPPREKSVAVLSTVSLYTWACSRLTKEYGRP